MFVYSPETINDFFQTKKIGEQCRLLLFSTIIELFSQSSHHQWQLNGHCQYLNAKKTPVGQFQQLVDSQWTDCCLLLTNTKVDCEQSLNYLFSLAPRI